MSQSIKLWHATCNFDELLYDGQHAASAVREGSSEWSISLSLIHTRFLTLSLQFYTLWHMTISTNVCWKRYGPNLLNPLLSRASAHGHSQHKHQRRCLNGSTVPMWARSVDLLSIHYVCKKFRMMGGYTEDLTKLSILRGGPSFAQDRDNTVGANMPCTCAQERWELLFFAAGSCQESKPWTWCSCLEVPVFWLLQVVHHRSVVTLLGLFPIANDISLSPFI